MAKFEIINNKWIKKTYNNADSNDLDSKVLKIDAIVFLSSSNYSDWSTCIFIGASSECFIDFDYSFSEKEQFEADLAFLEDLLYNR